MFSILLYSILSFLIPLINGKVIDVLLSKNLKVFVVLIISYILVSLSMSLVNYVSVKRINKVQIDLSTKMKNETIQRVEKASKVDREKIPPSEFQARINEINSVENLVSQNVYTLVISVVTMIMVLLYLSKISLALLLVSIIIMPMYYYLNKKSFESLNNVAIKNAQENINFLTKASAFFGRIDFLRLNKRLVGERGKLQQELSQFSDVRSSLLNESNKTINLISILNSVSVVLLMTILGHEYMLGKVSIGQFVTIIQYFSYITAPVVLLSTINVSIQPGLVAYNRNIEFNQQFTPRSTAGTESLSSEINNIKVDAPKFDNRISEDFKFEAQPGQCIEVRGENGSGKSTLLQIISTNYAVDNPDSIMFNNQDIKFLNIEQVESNIHFMEQEIEIIDGTLLDNLFVEDEELFNNLMEDELIKGLYKDISSQVNGIITSPQLSLGQKKKIALLRLFISNEKIILLDEPESALDEHGKDILEKIIKRKQSENCIILRVTHDKQPI
ncbi:ATP-binding cassette domain-containing protein [Mollicutes bacterium LVI A0039]|nr:ATP-binding cassette domain-containing protein [Mollicutes bacterium LVI A0039]